MKGLNIFGKFIFVVNTLAALLLLISYILPYVPPRSFASLSVLSLSVPLLIVLNVLFFVYWLLQVKRQMMLSFLVLLLGYNYIGAMYKFSPAKSINTAADFSIMSFNVRAFNIFKWLPNKDVKADITAFIANEHPDIISLQEYSRGNPMNLKGYYTFNARYTKSARGGQAIFSKYPIVNSGSLEFPETTNNAIFADVVIQEDTLRIYNIHLQSAKIDANVDAFNEENSEQLFDQVGKTFKSQQDQLELLLEHRSKCTYKTLITGDFNNTAYSYIYKTIKGETLKDTFQEAGNGFGKTYDFKYFPLRIDFILADKDLLVNGFKTYSRLKLSDHYPIRANLSLN